MCVFVLITAMKYISFPSVYQFVFADDGQCMSSPCANGGTCQDVQSGFECICTDQYVGHTCEDGNCLDINFLSTFKLNKFACLMWGISLTPVCLVESLLSKKTNALWHASNETLCVIYCPLSFKLHL